MLTPDHPNAQFIANAYRRASAIEQDDTLTDEERQRRFAEHIADFTSRFSPDLVIHTNGVKLAATGDMAFMGAYFLRRTALSAGRFRPAEVDQVIGDDEFVVLHMRIGFERDGQVEQENGMGAWRFEDGLAVEHWEIGIGPRWDAFMLEAAGQPDFAGTATEFWLQAT